MKAQEMLKLLENGGQQLGEQLPQHMEKFWNFAEQAKAEGALGKKEKALIALAVVMVKRCEHCMVRNLQDAIDAGVTREELAELCTLVMLLDGGPGFASSAFLLDKYDELNAE